MDDHATQEPQGIEPPHVPAVPANLLTNIMQRLEQREAYLFSHQSLAELLTGLEQPQWELRAAAVRALGEQAPLIAIQSALQDEHRLVRLAAVRALGKMGERAPFDALMAALYDSDWEVRDIARLTMQEMTHAQSEHTIVNTPQHAQHVVMDMSQPYEPVVMDMSHQPVVGTDISRPGRAGMSGHGHDTSVSTGALHLWYVFQRQGRLINKSVWIASALVMLLSCIEAFFALLFWHSSLQNVSLTLALFTTVTAATGVTFLYSNECDTGFELTISTPTSLRWVMFCRFLWVMGYNLLLSAGVSATVAIVHGGGFWTIIQVWFGPMLLVASLSLALSLLIGSWFSLIASLLLEISQTLQLRPEGSSSLLMLNITIFWHTSPLILALAALCLLIALLNTPRQTRLT